MVMGRPRKPGNKTYPEGFSPPDSRNGCRMIHPITGERMALKTRDIDEGLALFWQLTEHFRKQKDTALQQQFERATHGAGPQLPALAKTYREKYLPKAISLRGASKGLPLDDQTRRTYKNYLINMEADPLFQVPIGLFGDPDEGPRRLRQYLASWLDNPKTYNFRLTCYSRFFEHCIDLGHIQRNPAKAISNRTTTRREVYVPDDHYAQIMRNLAAEYHEVYARACDWLYILSGRVGNMLAVEEKHIDATHVRYFATKNRRLAKVKIDEEIQWLIDWFRQYKKDMGVISKYLIIHPYELNQKTKTGKNVKVRKKIAGKNITVERLYRRFVKAKAMAGLTDYNYVLKDLRPKAITDETEITQAPSNKGLHSEQAQRIYVKKVVAEEVANNLVRIRWEKY